MREVPPVGAPVASAPGLSMEGSENKLLIRVETVSAAAVAAISAAVEPENALILLVGSGGDAPLSRSKILRI